MHVQCVYVCASVHRSNRAGVTGGCEPPVGPDTEQGPFARAVNAVNHWALTPALISLLSCPTVARFLIHHMDIWLQFIIRCHLFSKHLLLLNKKTLRLMICLSLWTYSSPFKTSVPALPGRLPSGRSNRKAGTLPFSAGTWVQVYPSRQACPSSPEWTVTQPHSGPALC